MTRAREEGTAGGGGRGQEATPHPPKGRQSNQQGRGREMRRGTNRVERPYWRHRRGPCAVRTRGPRGQGERGGRGTAQQRERMTTHSARSANRKGHRTTAVERTNHEERCTTRHRKGHSDGATRHTSRETRTGQRQREGERTERHRPHPTQPQAGYCARQHSSVGNHTHRGGRQPPRRPRGPTGDRPVTRGWQHRTPGRPSIRGGGVVGKSLRPTQPLETHQPRGGRKRSRGWTTQ